MARAPDHGVTADSHFAVAIAVVSGAADAGLAVREVAESVGATWLPVVEEPFELAIRTKSIDAAETLLAALNSTEFRTEAGTMLGYDLGQPARCAARHEARRAASCGR